MYILQLFDNYAATYSLLVIGMVESLALSWVYGELLSDCEMKVSISLGWAMSENKYSTKNFFLIQVTSSMTSTGCLFTAHAADFDK